jgi:hypothetical protein
MGASEQRAPCPPYLLKYSSRGPFVIRKYIPKRSKIICLPYSRAYKNGAFTDLTIICGPLNFEVHQVVVGMQCEFFSKCLKFAVGKVSLSVIYAFSICPNALPGGRGETHRLA